MRKSPSVKTTSTDNHERRKANPDSKDLENPKEVWKDGETTPSSHKTGQRSGMLGRVADAGDIGEGQPSPYGVESQADEVARQTAPKKSGRKGAKR